jgi:hypothetical protein
MSISLVLIFFWGVECVNRVFTYFITTFLRDLHFYCPFFWLFETYGLEALHKEIYQYKNSFFASPYEPQLNKS